MQSDGKFKVRFNKIGDGDSDLYQFQNGTVAC